MPLSGDFDFIQAKVHGLRSRVYEAERLDELCDLRTIEQLWHRLYPEDDPSGHHALQRRLLAAHVGTLDLVGRHLPERLAALYDWMLRRFQFENLKVLLRGWKAREPLAAVGPFLAPLRESLALDAAALLRAGTLAEFIALIPLPDLRGALLASAAPFAQTDDTFFVESALDATYYAGLLGRHRQLPALHARGTERLVRLEAGVYNVLSLFRLKLNYGLPYEKARPYLVAGEPGALVLERLYDFPDFRDMLGLIPRDIVRPEATGGCFTIADLERVLWGRLLHVANRQFYRSVGDLGAAVAFYTVKRVELANLIHIIEAVRYGMEPAAIRVGLIRVREAAALAR